MIALPSIAVIVSFNYCQRHSKYISLSSIVLLIVNFSTIDCILNLKFKVNGKCNWHQLKQALMAIIALTVYFDYCKLYITVRVNYCQ